MKTKSLGVLYCRNLSREVMPPEVLALRGKYVAKK